MKTAVILLCFSVFLISVEGRSQPVRRVCPPIPLMYVPDNYCPSTPESPECSSDDDCSSRNQLCVMFLNVPTVSAQILLTFPF
ncbi:hypothetical protein Avbf_11044 [Armadillidium vulgare]|nr:hypothetical protein Avbf_11044 [Armadillidium vulgare]